ncbi:MAG: LLM class flavin-dependent oxidoreductase [Acidimicrobiales bacterium]
MMMRLNYVHPDPTDPEQMSDRYRAGIDLAEYADTHGFAMVTTEEHQATPIGWSPTPLLTASMILNRTKNLSVAITALLVPLHDPVRLAQQMAVIDLRRRAGCRSRRASATARKEYARWGRTGAAGESASTNASS